MNAMPPLRPARPLRPSLPRSFREVRILLRNRPDTEHELTTNRLLLASGILVYLLVAGALGSDAAAAALDVAALPVGIFGFFAFGLFVHILAFPGICHYRRVAGIMADVGAFSYGLHVSGEAGAGLFLVYFWAVLGNGFRFGVVYLALAAVAAVSGFLAVILTTSYWQEETNLSIGLIGALIVIPAYTAKLIRKLSQAKREAEEASQAKSLFLASMSHELRTPLNAIIGLSDLLLGMSLKSEHKDMVRTISRSGRSLLSLIEAVLDLSRIEAGQVKIQLERVDLPRLLKDVRAIAGVAAHAKGLRLALHMSSQTPRFVMADRRHLEEILLNLASNAVKFTERGHVRIDVDFRADGEGTALKVEVSDTGIGIDPSAHGRIFERFTQADGTILDRFGGTGLGLAIVRQLVRAMGGDIGVVSAPGEGSTFHFHLPVGVVTAQDAAETRLPPFVYLGSGPLPAPAYEGAMAVASLEEGLAAVRDQHRKGLRHPLVLIDSQMRDPSPARVARHLLQASRPEEAPLLVLVNRQPEEVRLTPAMRDLFFTIVDPEAPTNLAALAAMADAQGDLAAEEMPPQKKMRSLKLLIADDNKTNQMVLGKILETNGHTYEVVENGEAAVERMLKGDLDLVLMDVNMPVMNGIEATKFYRFASLGMTEIPIIAVTADATGEARQRCLEAGMAECLTKPLEPRRLLEAIEAVLGPEDAAGTGASDADEPAGAPQERPVIDTATCEALEQLGGPDFVDQLLEQFVNDSVDALKALSHAVAEENVQGFRNSAHALRSAAANVGAARIYQLCLEWREINDPELAQQGELHLQALMSEFERLQQEVRTRLAS